MSNTSTKSKMKYNRETYKRYEFNVRIDSKLNAILERYKNESDSSVSELIKTCLCEHFGIDRQLAEMIYVPFHFRNNEQIPNNELDKYFELKGGTNLERWSADAEAMWIYDRIVKEVPNLVNIKTMQDDMDLTKAIKKGILEVIEAQKKEEMEP